MDMQKTRIQVDRLTHGLMWEVLTGEQTEDEWMSG